MLRGLGMPSARPARVGLLLATTAVLLVALVTLPWPIASTLTGTSWAGPWDLARAVREGLVSDWGRAVAAPGRGGSSLADPTRFWLWFHLVKAVLAAGVFILSAWGVAVAWRARRTAEPGWRRLTLLAVSGVASLIALVALLMVIANVQGAVAPLSSVLSFLPAAGSTDGLVSTVRSLSADLAAARPSAATAALVHDFAVYHAVVAVLLAVTTAASAWLALRLGRRREWWACSVLVLVALAFAVLTAANISTALDPTPALVSFLQGVAR